ncbi:MAG: hypothetical protein WAU32_16350 [Thermoanaerobaculia bacterium]
MNGPALFEETQGFAPWAYALLALLATILVAALTVRQTTTVAADAVTVRFGPFFQTRIPLSDIRQAEATAYRPIRDYGGWGIRGFGRRRALNTRGNRGVLLTRTDGSTILIGSQKPRELLWALAHAGVRTEDRLPAETREF